MQLLLLLTGISKPVDITLKITFELPKGQNPTFEEFNDFLSAISKLHEYVIVNTQPEYFDTGHPSTRQILDWHKMEVSHICRKNPFELVLTFQLLQEGIATYWPFLKALIAFCKRYGRNSNDLIESMELLRAFFDELYERYHNPDFSSRISSFLKPFEKKISLLEKINKRFTRLLSDRGFRVFYDKFCSTTITISELVSVVEVLNLSHDFLGNENSSAQE
jgi:hypothetical protein